MFKCIGILFQDCQIEGDLSGFELVYLQIIFFDVLTIIYDCIYFTKHRIDRQCFNNLININDIELNNCLTVQHIHYFYLPSERFSQLK